MTFPLALLILLLLVAAAITGVTLVRLVASDGYGTRPVPRSRPHDGFEPIAGS